MDGKTHSSVAAMNDLGNGKMDLTSTASMGENDDGILPAVNDVAQNEVVILIVGNKAQDKSGVVDSLTRSGVWDDQKTNDLRVLTCKSPARVIVDTTPLKNSKGRSPSAIARRWISRNSLRRVILGKDVVVVCVLTCRVQNTCQWDMFTYSNCWVDVFGIIFNQHKGAVMVLVNMEGKEELPENTTSEVERFVQEHGLSTKNITYSNLHGDESVRAVIEAGIASTDESISLRKIQGRHNRNAISGRISSPRPERDSVKGRTSNRHHGHSTVVPFSIGEAWLEKENFGPWGPERVILFGRTGSGKSTLAQMLTLGELDKTNSTFFASAGIRGGTKEMQPGVGRGWYVLDTPGFGEPKDDQNTTISTRDVQQKIKKYVKMVEGTFSHYLYVVKKDRLDALEERLWEFFMLLFGEDLNQHFSVVVSGADNEWVEDNKNALMACFKGCKSFLSAEFPAIHLKDDELESEYAAVRGESLQELEDKMAKLNRSDMQCKYGSQSKMQLRIERDRANMDLGIQRNERIRFLVRGASMIFACCDISHRPWAELTNLLTVDDRIALLPE